MPDDRDDQDWIFEHHPDLIDERWAKKAAKAARRQARKDRRAAADVDRPVRRNREPSGHRPGMQAILSVILLVGGVLLISRHPWTSASSSAAPVPSVAPVPPSVTVTTRRDAPLDLNQPFGNTPAAGWRDGSDGIEPPAPVAVGRYSASQVATVENQVKQVLVAAHLDQRMLVDHDPTVYVALLAPRDREFERQNFAHPTFATDVGGRVTLLASGFRLLPAPVKVDGSMSVALNPDGRLLVHTNYVFAFPFVPTNPALITRASAIVAIHHVAEDFTFIADTKHFSADSQGLFLGATQAYFASMACTQSKQGYLAPEYSEPYAGAPDTENPDAYYDPNHALQVAPSC